jgi:integrase
MKMPVVRFRPSFPPRKAPKAKVRPRDYLSEREIEAMITACKRNRNALRDQTLLLVGFRHCLRSRELCGLRWSDVDLKGARLHVRRAKGGSESAHPLSGRELRLLRALKRERDNGEFVFASERGTPLSTRALRWIVADAGCVAGIPFPVNAHALRHSGCTHLSGRGMDVRMLAAFAGFRNIQHVMRYVAVDAGRYRQHYWHD